MAVPNTLPKANTIPDHDVFSAITDIPPSFQPVQPSTTTTATIPNITINISNPSTGMSRSGLTYTVAQPTHPLAMSPLSNFARHPAPQQLPKYQGQPMTPAQLARWDYLVGKYGEGPVHKHSWEWIHGDFLPVYVYQSVNQ